jgi:phage replication initiation protein
MSIRPQGALCIARDPASSSIPSHTALARLGREHTPSCEAEGVCPLPSTRLEYRRAELAGTLPPEPPQPPMGHTGVENRNPPDQGVKCLIDYLRVTFPEGRQLETVLELFGGPTDDWQPLPRGSQGYNRQTQYGHIRVLYDGSQEGMGIHVECSGQACRQLEADGLVTTWERFFDELDKWGASYSRIDTAIDDRAGILDLGEMVQTLDDRSRIVTRVKDRNISARSSYVGKGANRRKAWSVYFGNRQSLTLLRCYDKAAEREQKGEGTVEEHGHWIRVELELHDEKADKAVELIRTKGIGAMAEVIAGFVDFKEPGCTRNIYRKRVSWWEEFLSTASKLRLSIEPKRLNIRETVSWVTRSVAPALAAIALHSEHGMERLYHMLALGAERMKPHQLAMLTQLKHPPEKGELEPCVCS